MKTCVICKKEFEPKRKNQACCGAGCKLEKERRWQAAHYQKTKGTRILTDKQIEANRKRNRERYQNMDVEKKEKLLEKMRNKYHKNKEKA